MKVTVVVVVAGANRRIKVMPLVENNSLTFTRHNCDIYNTGV